MKQEKRKTNKVKKAYVPKKPKLKNDKDDRQERLTRFREEVLPDLEKLFDVEVHGTLYAPATMYKIIVTHFKSYDYYPMAQKVRVNTPEGYTWHDMTIDELILGTIELNNKLLSV